MVRNSWQFRGQSIHLIVLAFGAFFLICSQFAEGSDEKVSAEPPSEEIVSQEKSMEQRECLICQYVYDPRTGDPESNIAPETSFEDLPEDWVCPICGAPKSEFKKIEEKQTEPEQAEVQSMDIREE